MFIISTVDPVHKIGRKCLLPTRRFELVIGDTAAVLLGRAATVATMCVDLLAVITQSQVLLTNIW